MCNRPWWLPRVKEKSKSDHHKGMQFLRDFVVFHSKPKIQNKFQVTHSWILSAWPLLKSLLCAFSVDEKKGQLSIKYVFDVNRYNGPDTGLSFPSFSHIRICSPMMK